MLRSSNSGRVFALAGLAIASAAFGTTRSWLNAGGGLLSTAANWSPAGLPVAADVLNFNLGGAAVISFDVGTVAQDNFGAGTWNITAPAPHTATAQIAVGLGGASASTVNLVGGSFVCGGTIGVGSNNAGTLNVTGPTSSLTGTNTAGLLRVGNSGAGLSSTMNILNGGLTQIAGGVSVGAFGGSQGTLLVSGVNGTTHSSLVTTDASAGDITLGTLGNGIMTVTAGGHVTCADDFNVAPNAAFTGVLNVGTGLVSTVDIAGDLLISNNATALAAGTGTLSVSAAGDIEVQGTTRVGDVHGGLGTFSITGGNLDTRGLTIDPANGVLQHSNGNLTVRNAPFVPATPGLTVNGALAGDIPVMDLTDGATLTTSAAIVAGSTNQGRMTVRGNGAVITPGAGSGIILGESPGGSGRLTARTFGRVENPGATLLIVGQNGSGVLDIQSNGTVEATTCDLGAQAGSSGVATVDGSGALLDLSANLFIGGTSAAGGSGAMTISNGGVVSAGVDVIIHSSGNLTMNNGTLNAGGTVSFRNSASTLTNSTINANLVQVNNTDISASGVINARYSQTSGTTNLVAIGSLIIGNAAAADGVNCFGSTDVGVHSVTLLDSGLALAGDVAINGGILTAANGLLVRSSDSLVGTGTINGPVSNSGTISASGTTGLVFNGLVSGAGLGVGGTRVTFGPTGGFTGQGSINALVINNGAITATGNLLLGDGSTTGVQMPGTLNVGFHHVTLFDSNGLQIGQCTIGGGNLELQATAPNSNMNTAFSSHLRGFGTLTVPAFFNVNAGQISPGNPGASGTGALIFTGNYAQTAVGNGAGTLNIDIRDSESVDQLIVAGSALCGGTLNVALANDFIPVPGTRFTFLSAASVSGAFAVVNIPPGSVLLYNPTNAQILFPCPADFNLDGTIDFFDYLDFVDAFSSGDPSADFNNDTSLDFFDYLDFVDAFSAGC